MIVWGHEAGDELIASVAKTLTEIFPGSKAVSFVEMNL